MHQTPLFWEACKEPAWSKEDKDRCYRWWDAHYLWLRVRFSEQAHANIAWLHWTSSIVYGTYWVLTHYWLLITDVFQYRGSYRMRIYERENFGGQMHELMDDCDNIMDRYRMSNCMSCHVMDGHWLMYEQPHYRGRMMYMRPGEYRNFMNMGMSGMRFMSMRRIMDSCY